MVRRRLCRFVMLVASGAIVFQTTTSCSSEAINAFATSLSGSLSTLINSEITSYINQAFGVST
jgi:hypothetical protein